LRNCKPFIIEVLIATALGADTVFLVARQINKLPHSRQRMRQSRDRRPRQAAAIGDLKIPEARLVALEASEHVKGARHHLNDIALTCKIASEHSLPAEPLRPSSHAPRSLFPPCGIIFHLHDKLPQAICPHNKKAAGMPDIKIVTEVAGRVCALPVHVGASVGDGDDIAFVEAMKMEIPVASPTAGKLKSVLVAIDDVVAEGQVVAIIET
jgi:biotin carboxyl carrier protein